MNDTKLSLRGRLKAARLLAEMEQAELAERIGVARQTISNWERGVAEPSATYFVRWANETGQPLAWLAEGVQVRPEGFEPPAYWSVVKCSCDDWCDCFCTCSCHSAKDPMELRFWAIVAGLEAVDA